MGKQRDEIRRKQLRKNRNDEKRKNALIADYVQHKHANIYAEAVQVYERLNERHPEKADLRKTEWYRAWKSNVITIPPQEPAKLPEYEDLLELKIPIQRYRTVKRSLTVTTQTEQPVTVEMTQEQPVTVEMPQEQPVTVEMPQEQPVTVEMPQEQPVTVEMPQEQPVTVEMPDIEPLQPTLCDEIPQDLVDHIIGQLREDPDLKDIFDNVDELFEDINYETDDLVEIW